MARAGDQRKGMASLTAIWRLILLVVTLFQGLEPNATSKDLGSKLEHDPSPVLFDRFPILPRMG